jgi:uncharacterized glyoxalase superfamily protein PhnB
MLGRLEGSMIANRSVPVGTVLPHVVYRDVAGAVDWLGRVFGFVECYRYGDPVGGAMVRLGDVWVMLTAGREGRDSPAGLGSWTQMLTVFVEDVEERFGRVKELGVEVFEELHETVYGEMQFGVVDVEGHRWLFSRHARDVRPGEWGAVVAGG